MKTSFTRLFAQTAPEPQDVIQQASAPAEMPAVQMDGAATRALLRRAVAGIFRVQMNLCGVSGEDVEPVGEPVTAGDGASLLIRTPEGMVQIRTAADGSGSIVVHMDSPPPEPERQAEPPAAEESPEPEPEPDDAYPPAFAMLGRTPDGRLVEAAPEGGWNSHTHAWGDPVAEQAPVNPTEQQEPEAEGDA